MTNEDKMEGVIRKITALLNVKGCTEAEAEARTAKAQDMLAAYNLDMAEIGRKHNTKAKRKDTKRRGGLYSWQRKLWENVAKMNFCHYIPIKGMKAGSSYEHRLIGSQANVVATEHMATYLQQTVERHAQNWAKERQFKSVFVREAIAYREGMAARLSERLQERRDELVREEQRKAQEREQNIQNAPSGTNAVTILDVISTEDDLNNDHLNGWAAGTTANNRVEWKRRNDEYKRKEQEKWDALPKEEQDRLIREADERREALYAKWAKQDERARKRREKNPPKERVRAMTAEDQRAAMPSFRDGYVKGNEIGLDTQVDSENKERLK